jgi:hypothetical protein
MLLEDKWPDFPLETSQMLEYCVSIFREISLVRFRGMGECLASKFLQHFLRAHNTGLGVPKWSN